MPIVLKGARIDDCTLTRSESDGTVKCTGNYSLITLDDKVLARQHFGGDYKSVGVDMSAETLTKMNEFIKLFKIDLNKTLGMEGGET